MEKQMMNTAAAQAVYDTNKHRSNESQTDIYMAIGNAMMTFCAAAASTLDSIDNIKPPKNFEEAMQLPNWDDWCYATCKELCLPANVRFKTRTTV